MTKNQWVVEHREKRIKERNFWRNKPPVSSSIFSAVLHELYDYIYTDKQQATITLVCRYKEKLPTEYVKKHEELVEQWKPEAKIRAAELFQALIYIKNPFLAMIPKENAFAGKYYPVPIKYPSE